MKFFKPDRNFLGALLLIFIAVSAIGNFCISKLYNQQAESLLTTEVENTGLIVDSTLDQIRNSGDMIANACVLTMRDSKYYDNNGKWELYLRDIGFYIKEIALPIYGLSSVYLHLSPDICDQADRGIYLSIKDGQFIEETVTDLSLYNENDYEYVGWYYLPLEQKRPCWIEPYNKSSLESYVISYVVPLYYNDKTIGIFGIDVQIDSIIDIVQNSRIVKDGFMYLTDRSGSAIGRIPNNINPKKSILVERKLNNNMAIRACVPLDSIYSLKGNKGINILKIIRFLVILFVLYSLTIQIEFVVNKKRIVKKKHPFNKTLFIYAAGFIVTLIFQINFIGLKYFQFSVEPNSLKVKAKNTFNQTLNVTGDIDFSPFSYIEDGDATGQNVELFTEVCNRMGYNVNYNLMDWDDAIESVRNGENDVLLGLGNLTSDKDKDLLRSVEFFEDYFVIVSKHEINNILDVSGKHNAVIEGIEGYDIYGIAQNAVQFATYEQALQAIEDDVCEYGIMRESVALMNIDKMDLKDIDVVYYFLESFLTFGVAPENYKLLIKINSNLNNMLVDGSVESISYKWFKYYKEKKSIMDIIYDNIAIVVLTAFFAFSFFFLFFITFIRKQNYLLEEQGKNYKILSEQDGLTKIRNRGFGEKLVRQCIESEIAGAFCFFDIDKFKLINDTYGHLTGDKVLIEIAQCMKKCFRTNDILYRLGGDEFAIYLPQMTDMDVLKNKMIYFISLIDKIDIPELKGHRVCISAGLAFYDSDSYIDFDELYRRADQQAYISKKTEGSCFSIYS